MIIVKPSAEIITKIDAQEIMRIVELAGRVCYKSEDSIKDGSAESLIGRIMKSGHDSVIEHYNITMKFVCDRGVSHELVRHRLCSFSQESTRYANYSKDKFGNEISFIDPCFWERGSNMYRRWIMAMEDAEQVYMAMIHDGAKAQEARSVLPNSTKTEIFVTCNIRELRHIFNLRCDSPAHPQIREIMLDALEQLNKELPVFFGDLYRKFFDQPCAPIG